MEKHVVVMLGAPGAGKGTQAILVSQTFGLPHISTGDLFRANMKNNTVIGQKARKYMDEGQLVPDDIVLKMLYARIEEADCQKGYVLDGCPRTVAQAKALDAHLKDSHIVAINLDVADDEIVRRVIDRLVCEVCGTPYDSRMHPPKVPGVCDKDGNRLIKRKDDTAEVVQTRLAAYHKETAPVKTFYEKSSRLMDIDGTQGKEMIAKAIETSLSKFI